MTLFRHRSFVKIIAALLLAGSGIAFAQKVNIGYDKAADFSIYKTYTWATLERPTNRPILYQTIVSKVDDELQQKGLNRVEEGGDLVLVPTGGVGVAFSVGSGSPMLSSRTYVPPSINASMWTGTLTGAGVGASALVGEGTLLIDLVDFKANKVVWQGSLQDRFDLEKKTESLKRVQKGIAKLFKSFPPKKQN